MILYWIEKKPSGAIGETCKITWFHARFSVGLVLLNLKFYALSNIVCLFVLFRLYCLSFIDLWVMIKPLVSSNISYRSFRKRVYRFAKNIGRENQRRHHTLKNVHEIMWSCRFHQWHPMVFFLFNIRSSWCIINVNIKFQNKNFVA
jgi:hypothetical protein